MAKHLSLQQALPYLLCAAGALGLVASFVLTYDTIQIMKNTDFVPACNINPILSCGSVMKSDQANTLGLPNSIFGIAAFSVLLAFGLLLASGATFKRWVWLAAQIVATIGIAGMHYLFFQAVFVLHTICPWCFGIWMITIPTFWYISLYNLRTDNIRVTGRLKSLATFVQQKHGIILTVWYFVIIGILLQQFWYYWVTLV